MKKQPISKAYLLATVVVVLLASVFAIVVSNRSAADASTSNRWSGPYRDRSLTVLVTAQNMVVLKDPTGFRTLEIGTLSPEDGAILWSSQSEGALFAYCLTEGNDLRLTDAEKQTLAVINADPLTAEEQRQSDALLGTWVMESGVPYDEMTFTREGILTVTMPSEEAFSIDMKYAADGGALYVLNGDSSGNGTYAVNGDRIDLQESGGSLQMVRASGPLRRDAAQPESVSADLDARIVGTWGGAREDQYGEWTFHGDGTYAYMVPGNPGLSGQGSYTASDGSLTLRSGAGSRQATYTIESDLLGLAFGEGDSYGYRRKSGPLTREIAATP